MPKSKGPVKTVEQAAQSLGSPLYFEVATVRAARWAFWTVRDMFHAATKHVGATDERRHMWMWGPWIIGDLIDVYRGPGFKDVLVPEHRRGKP